MRGAKRHEVVKGSGDPVKRFRGAFKNQAQAEAAVNAEYARRSRGQYKLQFKVKGDPTLTAEANLILDNTFRVDIAGDWIVTKVISWLDSGGGYTCEVEAEKPNDDPAVGRDESASVADLVAPR
jgi:hypothetical protein